MIARILEPEVMDDPGESQAYDDMDHAVVNQQFVVDFLAAGAPGDDILDLGTGTARIPIELCREHESCHVLGFDAAVSMLEIAKINVAIEGFEHRIRLHHGDSKQLEFADNLFDAVISNSLLHHLPEPKTAIKEMVRVVRPGGHIFVRDLRRPDSNETVETLVNSYVGHEVSEAQQLFRQSLIAALTREELVDLVAQFGFKPETVQVTSDRHVTWAAVKD